MKTKGFTLIASLLMLLLMSGIAIGLMMMVNTEGKVGGTDLQNNAAYHSAEGGIEKMTSDLAATFNNALSPTSSQICNLGLPSTNGPSLPGVTWTSYQITPGPLGGTCPTQTQFTTTLLKWGNITAGPNQGLYAQIVPVNMLATAMEPGGQEVSMIRSAQVALIPVFQFGVFSESDLSFYPGSPLDFTGPVHTNGDLYPFAGTGATLTFHQKLSAYGNVIRTQLPNGLSAATNYNGTVYVPSADGDCTNPGTPVAGNCTAMAAVATNYGDGSVTGAGSTTPQPAANYNGANWTPFSSGTNSEIINGNYGSTVTGATGTGAKLLKMPFVGGGALPNEIVRRPPTGESATTALGQSREYNLAQIRVLLSDDPAELPGGAADTNNVRLANVTGAGGNIYGIPTSVVSTMPAPPAGSSYTTMFAMGFTYIPDPTTCGGTYCTTATLPQDWLYAPAAPPAGAQTLQPLAQIPLPPVQVGFSAYNPPNPEPTISVCTGATCNYPYYSTTANAAHAVAWNLIDGYLRVEYRDTSGNWNPVTMEWLNLGFARGLTPPTAPQTNPVNPNAILLVQEPADRNADGVLDQVGKPPHCLAGSPCTSWSYAQPPEVILDNGQPTVSGSPWYAVKNTSMTSNSWTGTNYYPINFYDVREGEVRDNGVGDNSCSTNGVMNAVEIDVGNLSKWLAGTIPGSGTSVDFNAQNGYILYFSDRRGMLPNPNAVGPHPANTKSGDAGLEDVINRASGPGTPNGLDPIPPSRTYSPEDVNENNVIDNFGPANMGLGFWGTVANATKNLNLQINSTAFPDPFGTNAAGTTNNRIASCANTARKNWVSGARHVLRLVDGSLGNVPRRTDAAATLDSPGGFTVASENPVYVWGDYNTNAADSAGWAADTVAFQGDVVGHSAAAVIADAVTLLSVDWNDNNSMLGNVTTLGQRNPSHDGHFRMAIAGGKNMNFLQPTYTTPAAPTQDFGTDGGVHNFLRYLETWSGQTMYYKGSLVSLFYATYNTGVFKCCNDVYGVPVRAFHFDLDFSTPGGLPPGTPMFRDVNSLSYRQLFTTRLTGQ